MAISRGDWIKLAVVLVLVTIGNVAFWQLRGQADVDSATRPSRGRMMKYDTVPPHARVPPKNPMKMAPVDAGQAMMTMMDELEVDEGPYSKLDALPLARTRSDYDELCGKPAASSATSKSDEQLLLIVPIRNRPEQQRHFIDHIYRFMCEYHRLPNGTMTAGVHEYDWRVLFVEQDPHDGLLFNRAKLLNAGYRVAHSRKLWNNCVQGTEHALEPLPTFQTLVLHDVDMLPFPPNRPAHYWSNDRIVHLASAVEEHGYRLPYASYVGGVLVVPDRLWHALNGMPNNFWGWGSEDNMVFARIYTLALPFSRMLPQSLGFYRSITEGNYQEPKSLSRDPNYQLYNEFTKLSHEDRVAAIADNGYNTTNFRTEFCVPLTNRIYHARVSV